MKRRFSKTSHNGCLNILTGHTPLKTVLDNLPGVIDLIPVKAGNIDLITGQCKVRGITSAIAYLLSLLSLLLGQLCLMLLGHSSGVVISFLTNSVNI
jgi:hypothetical protein